MNNNILIFLTILFWGLSLTSCGNQTCPDLSKRTNQITIFIDYTDQLNYSKLKDNWPSDLKKINGLYPLKSCQGGSIRFIPITNKGSNEIKFFSYKALPASFNEFNPPLDYTIFKKGTKKAFSTLTEKEYSELPKTYLYEPLCMELNKLANNKQKGRKITVFYSDMLENSIGGSLYAYTDSTDRYGWHGLLRYIHLPRITTNKPLKASKHELNFLEVKRLKEEGHSIKPIRRHTGLHRQTIKKYLKYDKYPEPSLGKVSKVSNYEDYIQQRWKEGENNVRQLWREIQEQGFQGAVQSVYRLVSKYPKNSKEELPPPLKVKAWSAKKVSRLLGKDFGDLKEEEQEYLNVFVKHCPDALKANTLAKEFKEMTDKLKGKLLDSWIEKAKSSGIKVSVR